MSTYALERAVADARPPRAFLSRVAAAGLPASPRSTEPLTEADPDGLPPEAIRYLRAMLGKAVGLVAVADGSGPEFDLGELTTWLDDAVLLAPGMLLDARTSWAAAREKSFRISVTDAGRTVSAEVLLDDEGRPRDFRSEDRRADVPGGPVRTQWSTPVRGWAVVGGRPRITGGSAIWHVSDGDDTYAEMTLAGLELDVAPGGGAS